MTSPKLEQAQLQTLADEEVRAVGPLESIEPGEVGRAAGEIDAWLKRVSGGYVSLEGLESATSALPIIGNVMAAVDAVSDLLLFCREKTQSEVEAFFNWVSLGINLLGMAPGANPVMRMGLRPMLELTRGRLRSVAHEVPAAVLTVLENHLLDLFKGDIELFIADAEKKLQGWLSNSAQFGRQLADHLAEALLAISRGTVFDRPPATEAMLYDNNKSYKSIFSALVGAFYVVAKRCDGSARRLARLALQEALAQTNLGAVLAGYAQRLKEVGTRMEQKLSEQASAESALSIGWLTRRLLQALVQRRQSREGKPQGGVFISGRVTAEFKEKKGRGEIGSVASQQAALADGNVCKKTANGKAEKGYAGSAGSLSFATGSETLVHTDFAVPGLMPIVWSRTYYSRLSAQDSPTHPASQTLLPAYLGARWVGPYTTRVEQASDGTLTYLGADGREILFPALAGPDRTRKGSVGQHHLHPVEELILARGNETQLILEHDSEYVEVFDLAPQFIENGKPRTQNRAVFYRLASQRTQKGPVTELGYHHPGGQLSDIVNAEAHVCTQIDSQGRIESLWLAEECVPVRQLAAYRYEEQPDGSSDLVRATNEDGAAWTYAYRPADKAKVDEAPRSTHLLSRYTDRTGRGMNLAWMHEAGFDRPLGPGDAHAKAYREWADDGSFETTVAWNKRIRLATVIDAEGGHTRYFYDLHGYTYRIVYPQVQGVDGRLYCHEEWFLRDARKNITTHVHPDGSQDRYAYDERSNLTCHTRADLGTVHFAYDELDNVTGIRDAEGEVWKRRFDGKDLIEEIDPLGQKTRYAYNAEHLPIEITDAKGGKQQLKYGPAGQLVAHTDCSGQTSKWSYNARGRLEASHRAGESTRYEYHRGQLAKIIHPDGAQEHLEYDAEGRLLLHRNPLQQETRYRYTEAGLIDQCTDANRHTIGYRWDRLGRLTMLLNENRREHRFHYDALGRLTAEVHFDDARTRYVHDPATGRLWQSQDAGGVTEFEFDRVGRLTSRRAGLFIEQSAERPSGQPTVRSADPATVITETYGYSASGRLVDAKNAAIHLQWFHDPVGNLVTEYQHHHFDEETRPIDGSLTAVWQHRYDELGNRISTTRPDGHTTTWLTYGLGHVHGLMLDDREVLQIERDRLHREVKRVQSNGVAEERRYDTAGRLKELVLARVERPGEGPQVPNPKPLGTRRAYRYDGAGQITGIEDPRRGDHSYRYDPVGRLLNAQGPLGSETFAFDPAGNILDPAGTTDQAVKVNGIPALLDNLVKDYAGTHFEYDNRGNMVRRVHNGESTRFVWDALGRLKEARTADTRTTFLYDPLGRRLAKRSEPILFDHGRGGDRWYVTELRRLAKERQLGTVLYGWDGDVMAWESDYPRGVAVHYVYESGTFVPFLQATTKLDPRRAFLRRPSNPASEYIGQEGHYEWSLDPLYNGFYAPGIDSDGNGPPPFDHIDFYQCDHLGTPLDLTDQAGNVAWEANFKASGHVESSFSPPKGINTRIRFQGQYFDVETELHYNRHRYYFPEIGRYVQPDPIRLFGGINVYAYVRGNPLSHVDPNGLQAFPGLGTLNIGDIAGQAAMNTPSVVYGQATNQAKWDAKGSPDYVSFGFDIYVLSGSITYTRYGDIFMGKGVNRAVPNPLSIGTYGSAGYMLCSARPDRLQLNRFLAGWSAGGGFYRGVGGSISTNTSGTAINTGLGFGGGGVSPGMDNTYQGNIEGGP